MFQKDFVWGVASSAYQVEGTDPSDKRGACVWDTFAEGGHIYQNQTAQTTCDHMHHYKEDYALMRNLGIRAYRFSISWARILPDGTGEVNEEAVQLYRDMIFSMKENGITPYLTLFHWEFPAKLQQRGGWLNPEVVEWFGAYAKVVAERFSDICEYFITINEPQCVVGLGHLSGVHAPGLRLTTRETFLVAHHLLMAHGKAVQALRENAVRPVKIGYAPTGGVAYPYTDSPEDIEAAKKVYFGFYNPIDNWTWNVSWFSDPVFLGHYPEEGLKKYAQYLPEIKETDMELIHQPIDFMGQNIYNGYFVRAGKDGEPEFVDRAPGFPRTASDWPVTPEAFYYGIRFLCERYPLPLYITENGISCTDAVSADGKVHDAERIAFLDAYIGKMEQAIEEGADVRGYFLWTFLDNFEWSEGYRQRFGLVHVDFATQKRTVKDSAFWYRDVMAQNGKNLSRNQPYAQPIFLNPVFTHNIWGGSRLRKEFGYPVEGNDIGECWGIAAHPNGDAAVADGRFAGMKLSELWKKQPQLFGNVDYDRFPLLIKIIDAKNDLSIQVHPDDAYAMQHENGSFGKTECWYVLDCPEGASLVIGHNARDKQELNDMIKQGRWQEFLREIPVKKGDFIQINPGTVHAIKGGLLILETQQNSDITYRVYDYDRLSNGKPRELHIEKSIDVITVPAKSIEDSVLHTEGFSQNELHELYSCGYYKVMKLEVEGRMEFVQNEAFLLATVVEGDGIVNSQPVKKGSHFILPFGMGKVECVGNMKFILSTVPSL